MVAWVVALLQLRALLDDRLTPQALWCLLPWLALCLMLTTQYWLRRAALLQQSSTAVMSSTSLALTSLLAVVSALISLLFV